MWADPGSDLAILLHRTDYAQSALFSRQVALWRFWSTLGLRPDCVLVHSAGELAVAYIAGIVSLSDACRLVATRGRTMQILVGQGSMATLEASVAEVEEVLQGIVVLEDNVSWFLYTRPFSSDYSYVPVIPTWEREERREAHCHTPFVLRDPSLPGLWERSLRARSPTFGSSVLR